MNSKRISLPQIPFEFGNFQKIDFTSFIEGENQDFGFSGQIKNLHIKKL